MKGAFEIATTLLLGAVLSTTWICIAVLARMESAVFLPQAVRFLGAASVLLVLGFIATKRLPQISLRLFHAAITVAALAYVLSPLLCYYSLRTLSSGLGALVYVSIPIWFLLAAYGEGRDRLWHHVLLVVGLVLVAIGSWDQADLRGGGITALVTLVIGMIAFMAGVWVSRRLFWLHAAMDLNFWSMLFAGVAHCLLAMTASEFGGVSSWGGTYWKVLLFLSMVVTGLGSYFYRVRRGTASSVILTIVTPILALVMGYFAWGETPINLLTVAGALLVLGVLLFSAVVTVPTRWLVLYLNNDKRQGDRLVCFIQGEAVMADGTKVLLQIIDIGIGGLGFRAKGSLKAGDVLQVSLPVAQQTSVLSLSGQVAHVAPHSSREFPLLGGLIFTSISESRWQSLVEFLARLTKAEEE